MVEFMQGIPPFLGFADPNGTWTMTEDHLAKIITFIGPFPLDFLSKGKWTERFFDQQGKFFSIINLTDTQLCLALS